MSKPAATAIALADALETARELVRTIEAIQQVTTLGPAANGSRVFAEITAQQLVIRAAEGAGSVLDDLRIVISAFGAEHA